jgi:nucleotide-binding universal stress UspA family protein
MYGCIVAPVDGSEFGERALPLAVGVAGRSGATLHLVHVRIPAIAPAGIDAVSIQGVLREEERWPERDYLETLASRLRDGFDLNVTTAFLHGPVAPTLERYVVDCGAGLVVMSTHAHSRFSRLWGGGVADHVSRRLRIPVLLTRADPHSEEPVRWGEAEALGHILVPIDGETDPAALLEHAVALGAPFRACYTLLRVDHPSRRRTRGSAGRAAALQFLNVQAERLRARALDVRTRLIVGESPADVILGFAFARNTPGGRISCIAMEAHPHGMISRILGSHTLDAVLRDTPVPVLLFEPGAGHLHPPPGGGVRQIGGAG